MIAIEWTVRACVFYASYTHYTSIPSDLIFITPITFPADLDYLPSTGILISNGTNICMSDVRTITGASLSPICIKADFNNARHLAADAAAKVVFYFDDVKKEINAHRILTGSTTVLASAGNVTGMSWRFLFFCKPPPPLSRTLQCP